MPNFTININIPGLNKAKRQLADRIHEAHIALRRQFIAEGSAFRQKWAASAVKKLKTSNNYINHLQEEISETDKSVLYTISHDYTLSNGLSLTLLLENGYGPFDMKTTLFTGKGVKISKKGYLYRFVPFNYHNPYKEGVMVTPPHISKDMHEAFGKMEKAGLVSKKGFVIMTPANLQHVGYGESDIKSLLGEKKVKQGKYNLKSVSLAREVKYKLGKYPVVKIESLNHSNKKIFSVNYKWKAEQFRRMQKKTGGTGGKVYQSYSTIRTMSTSPYQRQAWIHPGLKALNIFKDVYEVEKEEIPRRMQIYLEDFIKSVT